MIVGSAEADPIKNKISNESPVGKALLGKSKGTVVEIAVPVGTIRYEILDIMK
jgi:transcription elongation factor GreA